MSHKQAFTCDECGAHKKETNHWVLGQVGIAEGKPWAMVMPWDDVDAFEPEIKHFCGAPHAGVWATKRINDWQQKVVG